MSTKNLTPVLKTSFVLLAILVLLGIVMPDGYQVWSEQLREVISDKLGWFYLLLVTSIVLLCGFFLVSPVGQIKLGEPNSVPEHSTISWIAMIFSAGMGIFCWNGNRPCLLRCRRALIPLCHFNGTSYPRVAGSLSRCFPLHFLSLGHPCLGNICFNRPGPCLLWFPKKKRNIFYRLP